MWCPKCQIAIEMRRSSEEHGERIQLSDSFLPQSCPHCGYLLAEGTDHERGKIDPWEERLEDELAEVRELLAESSRLRTSTTRIDPPPEKVEQSTTGSYPTSAQKGRAFARMTQCARNALPRTPSIILILLGVGLLSGPWIHGFESIGQTGLSLEWVGHVILSIGGLLWLRDSIRYGQEISRKIDATIAGLHVLRKEIATPPQPNDAHHQLADLKRRLAAVARSVNL